MQLYAGVDLGGTKIAAVVMTGDWRVLARTRVAADAGTGGAHGAVAAVRAMPGAAD